MEKTEFQHLYVDMINKAVFYRGYRLPLTRTEYYVLLAIYQSEDCVGSEALLSAIDSFRDIGNGNVAVHIFNINSKTRNIDGSKLIKHTKKGAGYFIDKDLK
jgi:DNA-binding response OmpR family regulator